MNYEVKKLENSVVDIAIKLEKEETKNYQSQAIKKIAQNVEIPGFRKGKAPEDAILERYKTAIAEEIADVILKKEYSNIVDKESLHPVDYVKIKDFKFEEEIEIIFSVEVYPEIKVGQYKGLEVQKDNFEMTDEVLERELKLLAERSGKLKEVAEGETAKSGDTVNINFEGFVDGVAFEGGKAENYDLKLGTHSFIDNFEEQIEGHVTGDEFDVNVNFPENYGKAELAGKASLFKVKLNAIKRMEMPELNDEFAKETGFESLEDLKEKKTIEIREREDKRIEQGFVNQILEKIKAGSELTIPDSLIKREVENRLAEIERTLKGQGMALDMYLKMQGMNLESLKQELKPISEEKVKMDLIINEISTLEKVEITEEELEEKIAEVASYYQMEVEKLKADLKKAGNYENFIESLKVEKIGQKNN